MNTPKLTATQRRVTFENDLKTNRVASTAKDIKKKHHTKIGWRGRESLFRTHTPGPETLKQEGLSQV